MMQCLVEDLGADVNRASTGGMTPLYTAAQAERYASVVRFLVMEVGADVNRVNNNQCSPVYIAAQEGNLEVVLCLQLAGQ
jgi:ankyrin repeat protein